MKVWLLRDILMPFNTLGLYSTYEGAWRWKNDGARNRDWRLDTRVEVPR
jgi:hypothetical protein